MMFTEQQIVEGIQQSKQEIIDYLRDRFVPQIYYYVKKNSGERFPDLQTEVADLFQETIIALWLNIERNTYTPEKGKFDAYFSTIYKQKWKRRLRDIPLLAPSKEPSETSAPLLENDYKLYLLDLVYKNIEKLCTTCQQLYHKRLNEEKSYTQIKTEMGWKESLTKYHVRKCRLKLTELIKNDPTFDGKLSTTKYIHT